MQNKDPKPQEMTTPMENSEGEIFHVEPLSHLHYLIDSQVRGLQHAFRTEQLEVYIQGDGNFREEVAVTKPYKGKRTKTKPIYYQACRDYLVEKWGAVIINGRETDDEVCIKQMKYMNIGIQSVIVSPDKDLKNMFGYNYNPVKKIFTHITPAMAERHLWEQMVTGDNSVDNIPGVYRVGDAWVKKHSHLDNEYFKDKVYDLYQTKHDTTYMVEQFRLLHMCRDRAETELNWNMHPLAYDYYEGYREPEPIEYHPEEET